MDTVDRWRDTERSLYLRRSVGNINAGQGMATKVTNATGNAKRQTTQEKVQRGVFFQTRHNATIREKVLV